VKKVTDHVEGLRMNTAISEMMIFLNSAVNWDVVPVSVLKDFLKLLQPFAPHLAEELFSKLNTGQVGAPETIAYEPWPTFDPKALVESEVEIAVQINGKLRERIMAANNTDRAELEKLVLSNSKVSEFLEGKKVVKVIVVPNKLVNIVAK
jgi:leucyl-tRNA synthetase